MLEEEIDLLLAKDWGHEEKAVIAKMLKAVLYYKRMIPKSLKEDILATLKLCNRLKAELEDLRAKLISSCQTESAECPEST